MDADTYSNAEVIKKQRAGFISVKLDPWGAGEDLFDKLGGTGIPATYIIDAEGGRIRTMAGYVGPDDYVEAMEAAARDFAKLRSLRKAAQNEPSSLKARWALAEFARGIGNATAAEAAYRASAELLEKQEPRTAAAVKRLGEAYFRWVEMIASQDPARGDEAGRVAERCAKADPKNTCGFGDDLAMTRADMAVAMDEIAAALKILEAAAMKHAATDQPGRLWYTLGECRRRTGDRAGALAAFERAAEKEPSSAWGRRAAAAAARLKKR